MILFSEEQRDATRPRKFSGRLHGPAAASDRTYRSVGGRWLSRVFLVDTRDARGAKGEFGKSAGLHLAQSGFTPRLFDERSHEGPRDGGLLSRSLVTVLPQPIR